MAWHLVTQQKDTVGSWVEKFQSTLGKSPYDVEIHSLSEIFSPPTLVEKFGYIRANNTVFLNYF